MDTSIQTESKKRKFRGYTANGLKILAMITMFIDHIAAGLLWVYMEKNHLCYGGWQNFYMTLRYIGRVAFPIYCFFIVEGFERTSNLKKYFFRLLLFGMISEVPFDYGLFGKWYLSYQNVYFTLLLGLLGLTIYRYLEKRVKNYIVQIIAYGVVALAMGGIAELLHTDYGDIGVWIICLLYIFRKDRKKQCIAGAISFMWELTAPISFLFLYHYNGEKGKKIPKYLFYAFYPVHLAVIAVLRMLL